jgi:hypothetical protein
MIEQPAMLPPTPEEEDDCSITLESLPQTVYANNRRPSLKEYPRQARNLRVKFEADENQQIRVVTAEAASPSSAVASKEVWGDLWWSRTELMQIWKREQSVCGFYRQSCDDYSEQVRQIFARCRSTSTADVLTMTLTSTADAQLLAFRSSNRGLEHRIVNMLHLHRQKVLRGVLDQQAKVAHLQCHVQREHMIRFKSIFLSQPAQQFALVVAQADAIAAQSALDDNYGDKVALAQLSETCRRSASFRLNQSFRWGESFRLNESFRVM